MQHQHDHLCLSWEHLWRSQGYSIHIWGDVNIVTSISSLECYGKKGIRFAMRSPIWSKCFSLRNNSGWKTLSESTGKKWFYSQIYSTTLYSSWSSLLSMYEFTEVRMPNWLAVSAGHLENKRDSAYYWQGLSDHHKSPGKHKIDAATRVPTSATQRRTWWMAAGGAARALSPPSGPWWPGRISRGELRHLQNYCWVNV